jgi:exopolysaccharide biosynthesis polyprenyl glycosylphosphotransferase
LATTTSTPIEEAVAASLRSAAATPEVARKPVRLDGVKLVAAGGEPAVVWLAVFVPYVSQRSLSGSGVATATLVAAIWSLALRSAFAAGRGTIGTGLSAAIGAATGLLVVAAIDPWFPGLQLGPEALLCMGAGVFATAAVWEWGVRRTSAGRTTVLVVGTDELAGGLAEEMRRAPRAGFELVGRIGPARPGGRQEKVPCLGGLAELASVVEAQRPDIVVLTDERSYGLTVDKLLDVSGAGFRVAGLATFFEYAFGRVPLPQLTSAWFMGVLHLRQHVYARWTKRAFDILVASLGLLLLTPLLPLLAILVWRTDGPIVYRQTRLGEGGRPFTVYKFRTMISEAEASGRPEWATEFDQRVTGVGRFLRRTHLDEVLQLWNVLKGDMSMVGPRPERPEFVAMLEASMPYWNRRLLIKPGITGWAQIRCGYAADREASADKLSYDLWYIRHRNLAVDMAVCLVTAGQMVSALIPGHTTSERGPPAPREGATPH